MRAGRGRGSSSFELQGLEERRLMAASPAGVYEFGDRPLTGSVALTDGDGTVATFGLRGGKGTVIVREDGTWSVDLSQAARGAFSFAAAGGDGRVVVQDLKIGGGIRQVKAPGLAMSGGVLEIGGVKKTVTLGDVENVVASAARSAGNSSITLGNVRDVSLTSAAGLQALTVASWRDTDTANDVITAAGVGALKAGGPFAADLVVGGGRGNALGSATIGGGVGGDWTVTGNAGKVTVGRVTGRLNVTGNVAGVRTTDFVGVAPVDGGGSIRVGGKGTVQSAGEKTPLSGGVTAYTSASATAYDMAAILRLTVPGEAYRFREGAKVYTRQVMPGLQTVDGRPAHVLQVAGDQSGSTAYELDPDDGLFFLQEKQSNVTLTYGRFQQAPALAAFGQTYAYSSPVTAHMSDNGVTLDGTGTVGTTVRLVGHEVVTVPAGTFLAARFVRTNAVTVSGVASGSGLRLVAGITGQGTETSWMVPGIGEVKRESNLRSSLRVERLGTRNQGGRSSTVMLPWDVPAAPTVTASTNLSNMVLQWDAGTRGTPSAIDHIDFYRSPSYAASREAGGATLVGSARLEDGKFFDLTAPRDTNLYYWPVAVYRTVGGTMERDLSPVGGRRTYVEWLDDAAPVDSVRASETLADRIEVTWDPVPGAMGYMVYVAQAGTGSPPVRPAMHLFLAGDTHFTYDSATWGHYSYYGAPGGPWPGSTYRFWIVATNPGGNTDVGTDTGRVREVEASDGLPNGVTVNWVNMTSGYGLYAFRSTQNNGTPAGSGLTYLGKVSLFEKSYVDTTAVPGVTYYYWFFNYDFNGTTMWPASPPDSGYTV